MPSHPLRNFEIQKYFLNEHLHKSPKNLHKYAYVGTDWIALYCRNIAIIYFEKFGVEHVLKVIEKFIGHNSIKT